MSGLFDKHGGFRQLHSFTLATMVQLETQKVSGDYSLSVYLFIPIPYTAIFKP
jgi:hypothetical protein